MPINFRRKAAPQTVRSMVVDGQQLRVAAGPGAACARRC
jgi:hypothetical protein